MTRPALIRIERITFGGSKAYWRVWIFLWHPWKYSLDGRAGRWGPGRCRGATTLREVVEQARRARRNGVW